MGREQSTIVTNTQHQAPMSHPTLGPNIRTLRYEPFIFYRRGQYANFQSDQPTRIEQRSVGSSLLRSLGGAAPRQQPRFSFSLPTAQRHWSQEEEDGRQESRHPAPAPEEIRLSDFSSFNGPVG